MKGILFGKKNGQASSFAGFRQDSRKIRHVSKFGNNEIRLSFLIARNSDRLKFANNAPNGRYLEKNKRTGVLIRWFRGKYDMYRNLKIMKYAYLL